MSQCTTVSEVLSREELEAFITRTLEEKMPDTYPITLQWVNSLVQAFHCRLPFQNLTLLSDMQHKRVPSWPDIHRDVLTQGKGGLCLSLNYALAVVLRSLGMCAFNVAGHYVPSGSAGTGVHAAVILHLCHDSACCHTQTSHPHHSSNRTLRPRNRTSVNSARRKPLRGGGRILPADSLYLLDVGCGFPTLQALNLYHDLGKVFVQCGLEYKVVRDGNRYTRFHRAGDDIPEIEEETACSDGWRMVFSFTLQEKYLEYFHRSMRKIYINELFSPYFSEIHAVRYLNHNEMFAVKNTGVKTSFRIINTKKTGILTDCLNNPFPGQLSINSEQQRGDQGSSEAKSDTSQLTQQQLKDLINAYFPMIPKEETSMAVDQYFSVLKFWDKEKEEKQQL